MEYSLVGVERPARVTGTHLSVGAILTWLGVILLIAAVATNNIYQQHGASDVPIVKDLSTHIGAFSACYNYRDHSGCDRIDRDCQVVFLKDFPELTKAKIIDDCEKFNGARTLLVLAIILVGIGGLFQLLAALGASIEFTSISGFVLSMMGTMCAIASMSLFVSLRHDDQGLATKGADFDFSFVILTIGWVLSLISSFCFVIKF
jgi:hypothetical protein